MKWLLILLLGINAVLLVVQLKGVRNDQSVYIYKPIDAAKDINLLKEKNNDKQERCLVLGPVSSGQDVSDVLIELSRLGYSATKNEKTITLAPSYWVFVDGVVTDDMVALLGRINVESYVVASGDMKGRLSVGLFENIDLAQDMVASLKRENIKAVIVEKQKTNRSNYISVKMAEIHDKTALVNSLKKIKINLGEIKEFFCKSIASEK